MTLLLLYLSLAIGVSFFCSIAEAVILSLRPSYLAVLEKTNKSAARRLKELRDNLDRPLAAILTANTIAHTVGAAGVGAQASQVFGSEYLGITSGVLTLLILVFSEIIPKTIGAIYWQNLAPLFGLLIYGLTIVLTPFVWCSEKITRLLSPQGTSAFTFSRDEMQAMAEIGKEEGVLDIKEHKIVSNLMTLNNLPVRHIMTPRPVVFAVAENMTTQEFFNNHSDKPFSRIPIFEGNSDNITSYVLKTDVLIAQAKDEFEKKLREFRRNLMVLPESLTVSDVYDALIRAKSHIGLVVDEYGTMQGLVTQEDVMETLMGLQITDELDTVEDMQTLAHKRWRERMEAIGINADSVEKTGGKRD